MERKDDRHFLLGLLIGKKLPCRCGSVLTHTSFHVPFYDSLSTSLITSCGTLDYSIFLHFLVEMDSSS